MDINANLQNGYLSSGIGLINIHILSQCNKSSNLNEMNWDSKDVDISAGNCYMNSHTVSEANNNKTIDYTKKIAENTRNRSGMQSTESQAGVDIDIVLPTSKINQYENMEYNNEYDSSLMNGKTPTSKN